MIIAGAAAAAAAVTTHDGCGDPRLGVLLAWSELGSRAFRSGFWSEPEPPRLGLFGLFKPIGITFEMTDIAAISINIWLRYDPK